jgi:hypothetical protein
VEAFIASKMRFDSVEIFTTIEGKSETDEKELPAWMRVETVH